MKVLVWHCGCAANLFHYMYPWHMYTVKMCKSECSRVQCANVCYFPLHNITLYCDSYAIRIYVLAVVSIHLHSCMLFPVWCSALVLTDCQSNVLTPSICSMVTSLMDVMSYTCGCKLSMLLVMWSPVAVLSVLSVYTQYTGHHQVFCLYLCNLIHVLYTYMHTILYSNTFSCVNHYCPCVFVTHSCV